MRRLLTLSCALPLMAAQPAWAQSRDLNASIADALAHAPVLAEAQAGEEQAKARLEGARAQGNPLLSVEGQIGAGRIDNGGFFGFTAPRVKQVWPPPKAAALPPRRNMSGPRAMRRAPLPPSLPCPSHRLRWTRR